MVFAPFWLMSDELWVRLHGPDKFSTHPILQYNNFGYFLPGKISMYISNCHFNIVPNKTELK